MTRDESAEELRGQRKQSVAHGLLQCRQIRIAVLAGPGHEIAQEGCQPVRQWRQEGLASPFDGPFRSVGALPRPPGSHA